LIREERRPRELSTVEFRDSSGSIAQPLASFARAVFTAYRPIRYPMAHGTEGVSTVEAPAQQAVGVTTSV
jgi:hypothetical protein